MAYVARARSKSHLEDLKRTLQSLLNKVCPENVATIAEKIAATNIQDAGQLSMVTELIFKKALAEPHYCETYADLVFALKPAFGEFPSADGGKPVNFRSTVLNICQNEFEQSSGDFGGAEDSTPCLRTSGEDVGQGLGDRKQRMLANMKLIGHLFLRQLLPIKVVGSLILELLSDGAGRRPSELALECACELLMSVGHTLEASRTTAGGHTLPEVCSRLLELKGRSTPEGKSVYCRRVQFLIQDVLDTRAAGWTRKLFKSAAKTKEEVRQGQQQELSAQAHGARAVPGELVVAGQRPSYLVAGDRL